MLVSVVILALAALCAMIGVWAMRRSGQAFDEPAPQRADSVSQPLPPVSPRRETEPVAQTAKSAAAAAAAPTLALLEFEGPPGRVAIERAEVVIGRHSQDDIRVSDVRVSRHHARLVAKRDGRFEIHNLTADRSEPNPMQINGETREHADIADGDVVTLGGVSFTFRRAA